MGKGDTRDWYEGREGWGSKLLRLVIWLGRGGWEDVGVRYSFFCLNDVVRGIDTATNCVFGYVV